MKLRVLVSMIAIMGIASLASANLLTNPSFELGTGQGGGLGDASITGWFFSSADGWWANNEVHDGDWSIRRWGTGSYMAQNIAVSAGLEYNFSVWAFDDSGEALGTESYLELRAEWRDGVGEIGRSVIGTFVGGGTLDQWRQVTGSAIAPVGAESVNFTIGTENSGTWAGRVSFDDASMTQVIPEPATLSLLGIGFLGLNYLRRKVRR